MTRGKLLLFALLISFFSIGQEEKKLFEKYTEWQESKNWRINAAGAFSPGFLTENTQSVQLHGYLGFLQDRIEMRGDIFYLLNQYGDRPRFDMNHQIYAGAFYHFSEKSFQPYLGFQPGLALSRSSEHGTLDLESGEIVHKVAVNPLISPVGGIKYYASHFFYAFLETRYIMGKHKANTYPVHLDEWRFAFGMGLFF
jgi:hypothetical protein